MSLHNRIVHGYSEIIITASEYALLLRQYGNTAGESAKPTHSLPEKTDQYQYVPREVESGRESVQEEGQVHLDFVSSSERQIYEETLQTLQDEGGMSQEEMEQEAYRQIVEFRRCEGSPSEIEFKEP
jgi:hypothetical protein